MVKLRDYRKITQESLGLNKGEKIAIVYAAGDIMSGSSQFGSGGQEVIGSDSLVRGAERGPRRQDNQGGGVAHRQSGRCGSGFGHYLARDRIGESEEAGRGFDERRGRFRRLLHRLQANKIVAQPSTITGSIGVVGGKPVIKGFYDWIGVTNEYVLRGTNAGMFRESEKFSDSERAKFKEFLKTTYDDFIAKVAKGRGKDQAVHRFDRPGTRLDRPPRQGKRTGR